MAVLFWVCLLRQGYRSKNKQMRLQQMKAVLHKKETISRIEKATFWMAECL